MYSGLTNRATLEIVAYDEGETMPTPSTSTVRIGIRLEDGYRIEWSGYASSSIWSILESLASNDKRCVSAFFIRVPLFLCQSTYDSA